MVVFLVPVRRVLGTVVPVQEVRFHLHRQGHTGVDVQVSADLVDWVVGRPPPPGHTWAVTNEGRDEKGHVVNRVRPMSIW